MLNIIQHLTIFCGLVTVGLSLLLMVYFIKLEQPLARAFAWVLLGEAGLALIAVLFTVVIAVGDVINPHLRILLQFGAFSLASSTALHLAHTIYRIQLFK